VTNYGLAPAPKEPQGIIEHLSDTKEQQMSEIHQALLSDETHHTESTGAAADAAFGAQSGLKNDPPPVKGEQFVGYINIGT